MCTFHSANVKRYTYIEHNNWQFILLKNCNERQTSTSTSWRVVRGGTSRIWQINMNPVINMYTLPRLRGEYRKYAHCRTFGTDNASTVERSALATPAQLGASPHSVSPHERSPPATPQIPWFQHIVVTSHNLIVSIKKWYLFKLHTYKQIIEIEL